MKFRKIVSGIVCVIAIVAVCSIGSAEWMEISPPNNIIPIDGTPSSNYTITLHNITKSDTHSIRAYITSLPMGGSLSDLQFKFFNSTSNSSWLSHKQSWNWGDPSLTIPPNEYTLNLQVRANPSSTPPPNAEYIFAIIDSSGAGEHAAGTTSGTTIPEFPSVALAIAITLGIGLIMYRRKVK